MGTSATIKKGTAIGGFKFSANNADNNGWILLNGRATATLSARQQAYVVANYPTWGANIPNFTNRELIDSGVALGTLVGADTYTITQANLPNYVMNGTLNNIANNHTHPMANAGNLILHPGGGGNNFNATGAGNNAGNVTVNIANGGAHNHSFPIPLGAGTPISTETSYMSFNAFVYLGN